MKPAPKVVTGESCRKGVDDSNGYPVQSAGEGVVFQFSRMPTEAKFNPGLLELVKSEVANHDFRQLVLTSGYRDCGSNAAAEHAAGLRGVPNPTHIRGEAVDIGSANPASDYKDFVKGSFRAIFNTCIRHVHVDNQVSLGSGFNECSGGGSFGRKGPALRSRKK